MWARVSFVADTVHQMEATHPHAVGEMLAFTSQMFPIGPDDGMPQCLEQQDQMGATGADGAAHHRGLPILF